MKKEKICGIYKITNSNKSVYIGQSINIIERWQKYKWCGCKMQTRLYASFIKFGVENHIFEIIEKCSKEDLDVKEESWIKHYNSFKKGLNCNPGGKGNKEFSEESISKISKSQKQRWDKVKKSKEYHSEEQIQHRKNKAKKNIRQ